MRSAPLAALLLLAACSGGGSDLNPNVDPTDDPLDLPDDGCDISVSARPLCDGCGGYTLSWGTLTEGLYGGDVDPTAIRQVVFQWLSLEADAAEAGLCDMMVSSSDVLLQTEAKVDGTTSLSFERAASDAPTVLVGLVGNDGTGAFTEAMGLFAFDASSTATVAVIDDDSAYAGD